MGAKVYAPRRHAKFLAKERLQTTRGCDASNCHDEEAEEEDFSDDEKVPIGLPLRPVVLSQLCHWEWVMLSVWDKCLGLYSPSSHVVLTS